MLAGGRRSSPTPQWPRAAREQSQGLLITSAPDAHTPVAVVRAVTRSRLSSPLSPLQPKPQGWDVEDELRLATSLHTAELRAKPCPVSPLPGLESPATSGVSAKGANAKTTALGRAALFARHPLLPASSVASRWARSERVVSEPDSSKRAAPSAPGDLPARVRCAAPCQPGRVGARPALAEIRPPSFSKEQQPVSPAFSGADPKTWFPGATGH